jgi:predicted AAA+ superfamily ATPase
MSSRSAMRADLQVIATGSSSLSIVKGQYDLSRRSLVYRLPQLSLREYVNLSLGTRLDAFSLEELLNGHPILVPTITTAMKSSGVTILERFRSYLSAGAYPYFLGKAPFDYHQQVVNSITKVLYEDIPSYSGARAVRKPEKIYLANPNLYTALGRVKGLEVKDGTLRESFFLSQIGVSHQIRAHQQGDFTVDGARARVFEVGGKGKSRKQLNDVVDGFFALDDLEFGLGNTVPLWAFGFLY